jgi:hypothetical protein
MKPQGTVVCHGEREKLLQQDHEKLLDRVQTLESELLKLVTMYCVGTLTPDIAIELLVENGLR